MSSQEQFPTSDSMASPAGACPVCPQCQSPTTVKQLSPVLCASDLDEVIYGCTRCGAEVRRNVKRV